ncbi:MAG: aminoacetone oxidase family FAD-binding enzyme [bacterium]|nr:aminoacetone oxidase family FAD-binding enzyme [bacterium]
MKKTDQNDEKTWDVAVIGGGPAGMMCAGRAGELGVKVILIEKNQSLGKKLLITGGGRCNVTNAEENLRIFLSKFKKNDKFLFSAFSQYGVKETLDFFHNHKMETKVENEKRVFPKSNTARSVFEVMVDYLKAGKVKVISNSPVMRLVKQGDKIQSIILKSGQEIRARSFVIACGGKSRPETGSSGDGFTWMKNFGHTVSEPSSALVPIAIYEPWARSAPGVSLPLVKITTFQNNVKQGVMKGKILFTHFGLSGPAILNMSHDIGELLKYGKVTISLDLLPTTDQGDLNKKLQQIFIEQRSKKFKNSLIGILPSALRPIIVKLSNIDPEKACHNVTREERLLIVKLIKDLRMDVKRLLGTDKAVVTSGGVNLKEIDFKTMQSRIVPNLYIVGDMLDIDRPTGGYSLQICWTTGFVAGTVTASLKKIRKV